MPLPVPQPNEKQSRFMARCVNDLSIKKEFKSKSQRIAICYNKFSPNDSHMIDNECMSIVDCFLRSDLQQIISEF